MSIHNLFTDAKTSNYLVNRKKKKYLNLLTKWTNYDTNVHRLMVIQLSVLPPLEGRVGMTFLKKRLPKVFLAVFLVTSLVTSLAITASAEVDVRYGDGVILENGAMAPAAISDLTFSCESGVGFCGKVALGKMRGSDKVPADFVLGFTEESQNGTIVKGFIGWGEVQIWGMRPNYQWFEGEVNGNILEFIDVDGDRQTYYLNAESDEITGGGRANGSSFRWNITESRTIIPIGRFAKK